MSLHAGLQIQECGAKPTQVYAQKNPLHSEALQEHKS